MRAFFGFDERYERAEGGMVPDDDFEVIEARMSPIILETMPDTVKAEALITHATAVVQLLYAAMVSSGPGTWKDKEQALHDLMAVSAAPPPAAPAAP